MIKLKKGSKAAKDYMAKIRAMRKMSGSKRVYIDFYNKKKNFKQDRKYFKSDEEAKKWALKNLQKFDVDMIKEESENLGIIKKTIKVKRKLSGNPRRETQHQDTKSHNVNIRVLSGINELDKALKEYNNIHKAIDFNNKVIKNPKKYGNIAVKLNKVLLLSNKKMLVLKRKEIVNIKKHI